MQEGGSNMITNMIKLTMLSIWRIPTTNTHKAFKGKFMIESYLTLQKPFKLLVKSHNKMN